MLAGSPYFWVVLLLGRTFVGQNFAKLVSYWDCPLAWSTSCWISFLLGHALPNVRMWPSKSRWVQPSEKPALPRCLALPTEIQENKLGICHTWERSQTTTQTTECQQCHSQYPRVPSSRVKPANHSHIITKLRQSLFHSSAYAALRSLSFFFHPFFRIFFMHFAYTIYNRDGWADQNKLLMNTFKNRHNTRR